MLALIIGIALGALVAFGPLQTWQASILHAADSATAFVNELATSAFNHVSWFQTHQNVRDVIAATMALAAPGIVAALLMVLASAMSGLRHVIAALLIALVAVAFFTVEPAQAAGLAVIAVVAVAAALWPALFAVRIGLWVTVSVLAIDQTMAVWRNTNPAVDAAVATFQSASGVTSPVVWHLAASAMVVAPFAFGFVEHLKRFDRAG